MPQKSRHPGSRFVSSRQSLANMLMQQEAAAPPIQAHSQGLASMLRQGMAGYMEGADARDRSQYFNALSRALMEGDTQAEKARPTSDFVGPMPMETTTAEQNVLRTATGLANEGNEYAATGAADFALQNLARQRALADKAAERQFQEQKMQQLFQHQKELATAKERPVPGRDIPFPEAVQRQRVEAAGAMAEAKAAQSMSPTVQKELFEADETRMAAGNVMGMINEALALNEKAYSGPLAMERTIASRYLPGKYEGADAATAMDNIVRGQALESLKAVFGGMPTEGERKVLLELQASLEKTPEQRADILKRAKAAAERRLEFNEEKAKAIRSGKYLREGMQMPQRPAETTPVTPKSGISFMGFE